MQPETIQDVVKLWFGDDYLSWPEKNVSRNWFMGGSSFDEAIRDQFGDLIEQMLDEDLQLPTNAEETLATIILLDQFTRNIYRGTAKAFSGDSKALQLAIAAVEQKLNLQLPAHQRIFIYMPFEHAESLQHQQTCINLFDEMIEQYDEPVKTKIAGFKNYADEHFDIIKQFGRFPHRNKILGRTSTDNEIEYMTSGKSFGQ